MKSYDVIIIGGGPAGLTAGIYTTRLGLNTLLIEKLLPGGQAILTDLIENYPGFPDTISGPQLMQNIQKQAVNFGLKIVSEEVKGITKKNNKHIVKTDQKEHEAFAVIIATGAQPQKLNIPGENLFISKGVSYCGTCDGPLFRGKEIVVIGGGDAAIEEALFLTKFAKKVTVIHRRNELRSAKILQERAFTNKKIDFIWDSVPEKIIGEKKVERIQIKNVKTNQTQIINTDGVFIFIGTKPDTEFIKEIVKRDEEGYIITDENMLSSCEGIYACGDVRRKLLRQVVTACGEGATAGFAAGQYIQEIKNSI